MKKKIILLILLFVVFIALFCVVLSASYFIDGEESLSNRFLIISIALFLIMLIIIFPFFHDYKPEKTKIGPPKIGPPNEDNYNNIVQLIMHADNLNWQRFYHFLVFNSILLLAGGSLLSSELSCIYCIPPLKLWLLFGLSFIGLPTSLLWGPIALLRGIRFQDFYMGWARYIEREAKKQDYDIFSVQTKFARGDIIEFHGEDKSLPEEYREINIPRRSQTIGARQLMLFVPWLFALIYLPLYIFCLRGIIILYIK